MNRPASALLRSLSPLRLRLLVLPALGLACIALLVLATRHHAEAQQAVLARIAESDAAALARHAELLDRLHTQHLALTKLLCGGTLPGEAPARERAEPLLAAIEHVARKLELASAGAGPAGEPGRPAVRVREYARAAAAALESGPRDCGARLQGLARAQERLAAVNRGLYHSGSARMLDEFGGAALRAELSGGITVFAGLAAAAALLALSLILSRRLARPVEARLDALAALVTEEVAARDSARQRVSLYEQAFRSTGEAILIADAARRIVDVNPAYQNITGRARDGVIGTELCGPEGGEHPREYCEALWLRVSEEGRWSGELGGRRRSGEAFPWWAAINALKDENGAVASYVCVMRDITALKQGEQELRRLAFHDPLTGLANRALFNDRLRLALLQAERRPRLLAVMYIDLDGFKDVNDALGHSTGDRLLVEAARRIGYCVRASDVVARLGGDEFTVLLAEIDGEAEVLRIAERIVAAVAQPLHIGGRKVAVGASVGICLYPQHARDAEALQQGADLAMYEAKRAGRSCFRLFHETMLAAEIEKALRDDELALFYQPIVELDTGRAESVEALLRWHKAGAQWVAPSKFIPYAEEAGLIAKIDAWVLERACREAAARLREHGIALRVCVNLSALSIQQPGIAGRIREVLEITGLPPDLLGIEITETAVIADPAAARRILAEIAALGVSLSLDDFGTGYSSMNYLTRYPISRIKLDCSFVSRIGEDPTSEVVIRILLQLAWELKLGVVAEGVERREQAAFLANAGCRLIQGYLIARPMPAQALLDWLAAASAAKPLLPAAPAPKPSLSS